METFADPFATKGVEYLIAIAFLLLLVGFWRLITRPAALPAPSAAGRAPAGFRPAPEGWFAIRDGHFFHQGHSWAAPESGRLIRVGMDDFAQKLVGQPGALDLPRPGTALRQGEPAWHVVTDSGSVAMLSPVDGEVVAINPELEGRPELVCEAPYDDGWLLKVRVSDPGTLRRNLLTGGLARAWMEETNERVRTMSTRRLGLLLPDGGVPVHGFARALGGEDWVEVAEEFLLSR